MYGPEGPASKTCVDEHKVHCEVRLRSNGKCGEEPPRIGTIQSLALDHIHGRRETNGDSLFDNNKGIGVAIE